MSTYVQKINAGIESRTWKSKIVKVCGVCKEEFVSYKYHRDRNCPKCRKENNDYSSPHSDYSSNHTNPKPNRKEEIDQKYFA